MGRGKNSCVFGASEKPMVPTAPHLAATLTVESCPFAGTDVGYDRVPPIYTAVRPYRIIVPSLHSCIYQEYIVLYTYTRTAVGTAVLEISGACGLWFQIDGSFFLYTDTYLPTAVPLAWRY